MQTDRSCSTKDKTSSRSTRALRLLFSWPIAQASTILISPCPSSLPRGARPPSVIPGRNFMFHAVFLTIAPRRKRSPLTPLARFEKSTRSCGPFDQLHFVKREAKVDVALLYRTPISRSKDP